MKTLPPGSIIGILGGGQLGRMTALAAAKLGYHCHIFCTDKSEPAVEVAAYHTISSFDDKSALEHFARAVDVVTLEWENVPLSSMEIVSNYCDVHPSLNVLKVAQDREQEKNFARQLGIPTTDFALVHSVEDLTQALTRFKRSAVLKSTRFGYDGKGQITLTPETSPDQAWKAINAPIGILEAFVDFACEISVIIAARSDGAMKTFPVVENIHRNHMLAETHAPANIDSKSMQAAEHYTRRLAEELGVIGLLAVEFFVLREPNSQGHSVLMNEIAPRPHNSGHWTMDGCTVSQFEQLVRAVCGLPLAETTPHSRVIMHNIIGEDFHLWPSYLQSPNAYLH